MRSCIHEYTPAGSRNPTGIFQIFREFVWSLGSCVRPAPEKDNGPPGVAHGRSFRIASWTRSRESKTASAEATLFLSGERFKAWLAAQRDGAEILFRRAFSALWCAVCQIGIRNPFDSLGFAYLFLLRHTSYPDAEDGIHHAPSHRRCYPARERASPAIWKTASRSASRASRFPSRQIWSLGYKSPPTGEHENG